MKIIYEDDYILAVHKPAGLATQTSRIGERDLFSEAKNHVKGNYIGIINRLDQPVEGLVLMAKSSKIAASLEEDIQKHRMDKYYHAHVFLDEGSPEAVTGPRLLTDYLCRDKNNCSRVCKADTPDAKEARLEYTIESIEGREALLNIHLLTGRHHQIRVQLSNAAMPILGDRKYGSQTSIEYSMTKSIRNVKLCAYRLVLRHPVSHKELDLRLN